MATTVLLLWPIVAIALFGWLGRERGFIWAMVIGYLFLPERTEIALPGLPDYEKYFALSLGVLAGSVLFRKKLSFSTGGLIGPEAADMGKSRGLGVLLYGLLGLILVSAVMTVQTNPEALINGPSRRPGLGFRDLVSMVSSFLINSAPLFLAMELLRTPQHREELLKAIVIVGAFYGFLAAFEARMSPQLNIWTYGYFQHSWRQHLRDGFRPIVFLNHGVTLGFFLLTVVLAAFTLFRQVRTPYRLFYLGCGLWVLFVLLISRNLGATMLAAVFVPIVFLTPRFIKMRVAVVCAGLFLAYPAVWQSQILPIDRFMEFVTSISEARAQSLQVRLDNEAEVLARALEKPVFGWGVWDRWRIFDEAGRDQTTSDGIWVRTLGVRGWLGYLCFFGIITLPLFFMARVSRDREGTGMAAGMALILAANLIYMIPNATLTPMTWLLAGTLAGYVRWYRQPVTEPSADQARRTERPPAERAVSRYTRFTHNHSRGRVDHPKRG